MTISKEKIHEMTFVSIVETPCPYCGKSIHFWQKWGWTREGGIRIHVKCAKKAGIHLVETFRGHSIIIDLILQGRL